MTHLVLGSTGLLGRALMKEARNRGVVAVGLARRNADRTCDITDDRSLAQLIREERPAVIINAAALVNLDECERHPGNAYVINARPAGVLAELAREVGAYLVQISTDHYYQGDGTRRHLETEPVRLVNEYARSKYLGEVLALQNLEALVLRTNLVGFRGWKDSLTFVEGVIEALREGRSLTLFEDYYTSSIEVGQLSRCLLDLVGKRPRGVMNLGSCEVFSKKDFIESLASRFGFSLANTATGSVSSLASPRASSLGLNVEHAESVLGYRLPTLVEVIDSIASSREGLNDHEI